MPPFTPQKQPSLRLDTALNRFQASQRSERFKTAQKNGQVAASTAPPVKAPAPTFTTPSGLTGTEGQLAALGRQQAPTPTPPTLPPQAPPVAPTPTAPTPVPTFQPTPVDPQVAALRARVAGGFAPTTEETGLQAQLANILTGEERGLEAIRTQPIPTPFLRGQAAALERQTGIQAAPLQRQLGLLQQQRQQEQQAAQAELGFAQTDIEAQQAQQAEFQQSQQEQSIANLVTQGVTNPAQIATQLGIDPTQVSETLEALGVEAPEPFTLSPGQIRFGPGGEIVATGGPRLQTEAQISTALKKQETSAAAREAQISTISTINNILSNDNLGRVSGISRNILGAGLAGTADVRAQLSQLKALTSLEGRSKLKGTGTISDFEAGMLANSANALNFAIQDDGKVAMSDEQVVQNLKNIRGVLLAKTGEPVTIVVTDPATNETRVFENQSREDIEDAALQGFLIDYQ